MNTPTDARAKFEAHFPKHAPQWSAAEQRYLGAFAQEAWETWTAAIASAQAASAEPVAWRDFLKNLIERCEHGDINAECDDPDWRDIYVKAQAMLAAHATTAVTDERRILIDALEAIAEGPGKWDAQRMTGCALSALDSYRLVASPPEPQAEREGWKLVPMEPTYAMLDAGGRGAGYASGIAIPPLPREVWAAMLAASPAPEPREAQEVDGTVERLTALAHRYAQAFVSDGFDQEDERPHFERFKEALRAALAVRQQP